MTSKMNISFFLLLLLQACSLDDKKQNNDYFEGKIVYKTSVQSKSESIDAVALQKLSGDSSIFYFKEGSFKQFYNADGLLEETYNQKTNKAYIKKDNSDSLFWYDRSDPGGKILKYVINKNTEQVLGVNCNELVTYYDNKIITYYYNPDSLKVKDDWYKTFNYSNKNFTTKQMGTLYLKCKMEYPQVIFTITASSISYQKIDDQMFEIPQSSLLVRGQ